MCISYQTPFKKILATHLLLWYTKNIKHVKGICLVAVCKGVYVKCKGAHCGIEFEIKINSINSEIK